MTPDEKKEQMIARNTAICAYYEHGHKLSQCASYFRMGRQRIQQILQAAGVWVPYVKTARTRHVGIHVTEEGRAALQREAARQGSSMSAVASGLIEDLRIRTEKEGHDEPVCS